MLQNIFTELKLLYCILCGNIAYMKNDKDSFLCMFVCLFAISSADFALVILLYASQVSERLIVMHILWYRVL